VPKQRSQPTRDYFVAWLNAFRLLWHVFTSPGSRRNARERRIDSARPALRDVMKNGGYYWYLPFSLNPLFAL
jgi:hypothetical protein